MKQAFLITGFNNWGKSTLMYDLFFPARQFRYNSLYPLYQINTNAQFTVETHSNDDYWGDRWINLLRDRIRYSPDKGKNLFSALCPSMEPDNHFPTLLSSQPLASYDKIHLFLIEYKWEHNAKLLLNNIINQCGIIPNINFITIAADQNKTTNEARRDAKVNQIRQELRKVFS